MYYRFHCGGIGLFQVCYRPEILSHKPSDNEETFDLRQTIANTLQWFGDYMESPSEVYWEYEKCGYYCRAWFIDSYLGSEPIDKALVIASCLEKLGIDIQLDTLETIDGYIVYNDDYQAIVRYPEA